MILGKPQVAHCEWNEGNIRFVTQLPTEAFAQAIGSADWVISRGGYSTVMDMAYLGAKCIFVPTPGQYEQVYLAKHLASSGYAVEIPFGCLSAGAILDAFGKNVALPQPAGMDNLRNAIKELFYE